ncbi:hypothetical protein DXB18_05185 [Clostridium sp. OM02-18AC]|uniref:SLC13 family permease n=1 Tax=Clostridium sp. OM02-18AC TaxID=2292311 RepID=UPI000E537E7A|nr:SLC13 family permease [Clostridium sp. OM02-18AC]RHV67514.1 hypothetical protein DXB18_05185 [Clostridium sp. OM02-18AC]
MSLNVIITLLMFVVILVLLLKNVSKPGVIFTGVPIIAALLMGFSLKDINGFIGKGLQSISGTTFLMVFAVMFFGMLHDAGVFKALIKFLTRFLKNSVPSTIFIAQLISMLTQLDSSGATTALLTIPSMKPLFERQHIRMEALLLVESIGSGVLLLLPYMPGFVENTAYVNLDVYEAYQYMIPVLIFCVIAFLLLNIPLSMVEIRHGAGMTDEEFQKVKAEMDEPIDFKFGKGIAIFDGVFTLLMVALILAGKLPTNLGFGLGFVILLFVNYPKVNDQKEYIKRNAPTAFEMAFTMLGVGVLVGINGQTGAMNELADTIVANLPTGSITWILLVFCIFSLPLSMVFGNAKGAVLVPALVSVLAGSGLTPVQIMPPTWAAGMVAANLSLFNASPYLALGLAGVEMKDHLKYSFLPCWGFSIMTTVFMLLIGKLPL